MFRTSAKSAFHLNVSCHRLKNYCEIQNLKVFEENQKVELSNGFEPPSDVNQIKLKCHPFSDKSNQVKFLPLDFFAQFNVKIVNFIFIGCKDLSELKGNEFNDGTNLIFLTIMYTNLSVIDEKTFRKLGKLNSLDISSNQLETLSIGVFRGLENLNTLKLSHNKLKCLQENLFEFNAHLQYLDVVNNSLSYVGPNQFEFIKIRFAYLKENQCAFGNYKHSKSQTLKEFLKSVNCNDESSCTNESKSLLDRLRQALSFKDFFFMLSYSILLSASLIFFPIIIIVKNIVSSKKKMYYH